MTSRVGMSASIPYSGQDVEESCRVRVNAQRRRLGVVGGVKHAAVLLDDAFADGQAQAAAGRLGADEGREEPAEACRG